MIKRASRIFSFFEEENKLTWFIVLVGAILIFWVSSCIFGTAGFKIHLIPIIYHITSFFFFSTFLLIAISKGKNNELLASGVILALIYAISDEIHQYFVPGRACSLFDLGLDSIGICLATMIYLIILISREKTVIPKIPKIY